MRLIGIFKSLCAKFLSGIVPATGVPEKGFDAQSTVHRRVEVTVERESVSVLVPSQPAERAGDAGRGRSGTEGLGSESLPARAADLPAVTGATESPTGTCDKKENEGKS